MLHHEAMSQNKAAADDMWSRSQAPETLYLREQTAVLISVGLRSIAVALLFETATVDVSFKMLTAFLVKKRCDKQGGNIKRIADKQAEKNKTVKSAEAVWPALK